MLGGRRILLWSGSGELRPGLQTKYRVPDLEGELFAADWEGRGVKLDSVGGRKTGREDAFDEGMN